MDTKQSKHEIVSDYTLHNTDTKILWKI